MSKPNNKQYYERTGQKAELRENVIERRKRT